MEKLNELWLEYEATIKWEDFYDCDIRPVLEWNWKNDLILISKSYWFIQWLVENEKVDFSNIDFYFLQREQYTKTESLLMLLSIQDNPIEFLVSILK